MSFQIPPDGGGLGNVGQTVAVTVAAAAASKGVSHYKLKMKLKEIF
jgi:hypothetical protein